MDVALYVFFGLFCLLVVGIFVVVAISVIQQRRTPLHVRIEEVKAKLLESETPEGTTQVYTGHRVGVKDDMVRDIAEKAGFRWTGYTGLNNQILTFQREIPAADATTETTEPGSTDSPLQRITAELRRADAEGATTCRVDVTGFRKDGPAGSLADVVRPHGWVFDRTEREGSTVYAVLRRAGAPVIDRRDPLFVSGPSIAALRRNDDAVQEARVVEAEFGLDPLSDDVATRVQSDHVRLRRASLRWMWPTALFAVALFVVLMLLPAALRGESADASTLWITALALLVAAVACSIPAVRFERARRTATKTYTAAYQRVAAAAMRSTRT